jgi:hypothetical protein
MKKTLFLFAAATMVCSAKAAETLATFEAPANDVLNTIGGASSLQIVANPAKTDINGTDSCLLNTRPEGQGWNVIAHLYSSDGDSVAIGDATRYLHLLAYSPEPTAAGKIIVRTTAPVVNDGYGDNGDNTLHFDLTNTWKDIVLDLQTFGNAVYGIYFISQDWGGTPAGGRAFYYDEIVLTNSPTPRGAITAAATLGNFEAITPDYAVEDGAFSTLQVASNPDTAGINASDSVLHGYNTKSDVGSWWGGLRITPTNVQVNANTRYLHVMMYTNLPTYEFDLFSSKGEDWMGKTNNTVISTWFDHVVDLYSKDLEGKTLNSFRISAGVDNSANLGKDLYIDEIEVNSDSLPRVPTVTISLNNNNVSVAKGATQQFTASVTVAYGATPGISWSVAGGVTGTSIDTGVLIVAADETAATLTVTATSVFDGTKSASVTVLVSEPVATPELASFEDAADDAFDDINGTWSPLEIVDNPDATGINTSSKCLLNTRTTGWTEGGHLSSSRGNFAQGGSGRYLHVMVYSPYVVSGLVYVQHTNVDDQWSNGSSEIRFEFQPTWKDVVMDLRDVDAVYGIYFLSQDWDEASTTRYFYYDEIVVNDDPMPRGETLIKTSGVVGDFEDGSAALEYTIEGSALSTLDVVTNPDKAGINPTGKALYGLSSMGGESWGGARVNLGSVLINDSTRYLHVLMKTNVPHYEFDIFPMAGEGGEKYAGEDSTTNLTSWFDHVVDLYDVKGEKNFENHVLIAFRVVVNVQKEENKGKDLYLDEIVFNNDPAPRAPSVAVNGITPANPSVAKGATLQLAASVTVTGGADSTVTWSVANGVNMTGITANGLLSVAATETAASLTVIATSVYDNTKSATASVTVTAAATAVEKMQRLTPLSVYPNPTTGVVYVENEADGEVSVYSVKGELLLRTVGRAVDLSGLPGGVYVIKAGGKVAKVVKK